MQITPEIVASIKQAGDRGFVQHFPKTEIDTCVITAICDAVGLTRTDEAVDVVMPPTFKMLLSCLNDAPWASSVSRGVSLSRLAIAFLNSGVLDESVFIQRLTDSIVKNNLTAALRAAASVCPFSDETQALADAIAACEKRIPDYLSRTDEIVGQVVNAVGKLHEGLTNQELAHGLCYQARKSIEAVQQSVNRLSDAPIEASRKTLNLAMYRTWFAGWYCVEAQAVVQGQIVVNSLLAEFTESVIQILIDLNAPGARWL